MTSFAKKIMCPTLIVWGDGDCETPMWMAKRLKRLISGSGLVVLENAGISALPTVPKSLPPQ